MRIREAMRQDWDTLNRPKYQDKQWSAEQQDAIERVQKGVSYEDEDTLGQQSLAVSPESSRQREVSRIARGGNVGVWTGVVGIDRVPHGIPCPPV